VPKKTHRYAPRVEAAEGLAARRLLRVVSRIKSGLPLDAIQRAFALRNTDAILRIIGMDPFLNALSDLHRDMQVVRDLGWEETSTRILSLQANAAGIPGLTLSFRMASPQALAALELADLSRLQRVGKESQEAIRRTLFDAYGEGINPVDAARRLRGIVGLTDRQAVAVRRFEDILAGKGKSGDVLARLVDRYAGRMLRIRTETIARTEIMTALHTGRRAHWHFLAGNGTLRPTDWQRRWKTAPDEFVCRVCQPLHNTTTDLFGMYPDGSQGPPRHPRCRCTEVLQLAGWDEPARRDPNAPLTAAEMIAVGMA
jgi:hypothetical protein